MGVLFPLCFTILIVPRTYGAARDDVTVTCTQGKVRGIVEKTVSGRDVVAFLGIPYAQPAIGKRRFKDPVPPESWIGTLDALAPPNVCLQPDSTNPKNLSGSEDCLYLNVFIPKNAIREDLMDVMVYIHGGGFLQGSSNSHSPSYLLDQEDVALVVVNYRLGILGFLSLLDEHLPGNFGMKDQTLALKWVRKNIAHFGGDPNKVTVVGCSAGGASVHLHLLSPLSHGLFQAAIMTSGSAFNPWALDAQPQRKAFSVAEALGCPTDDHGLMVNCMRQRPAERITAIAEQFTGNLQFDVVQFSPVIEPPSPSAFIDDDPEEIIRSGRAMDIPLVFAYMEDDAIFATAEIFSNPATVQKFEDDWTDQLTHMKFFDLEGEAKRCVAESIRKFYLGQDGILDNPANFTQMYSDWAFKVGIEKAAKLHASYAENPVYAYIFSYVGGKRYSDYYNTSGIYKGGACHGDDLYYVLETSYLIKRGGDPKDDAMSRYMIDLWMKFMRREVPENWQPIKSSLPQFTYLNITGIDSRDNKVLTKSDNSVNEFWESMEKFKMAQKTRDEL